MDLDCNDGRARSQRTLTAQRGSCRRRCGGSSSTSRRPTSSPPRGRRNGHRAGWRRRRAGPRRRAPQAARAARRRLPGDGADADRAAQHRLRRRSSPSTGVAAGPPGRGAGADRPLGLRQDDAPAVAQPARRPDPDARCAAAGSCSTAGRRRARRHPPPAPRRHALPAAEPVPDERLRQRRVRLARRGARSGRSAASSSRRSPRRLQRAGLFEEVKDNLEPPRAARSRAASSSGSASPASLAVRPEVLLLDEPCSALDPISTAVIEEQIVKLRAEVAIVIVTHNLQQAQRSPTSVAFMYLGDLVEYGRRRAGLRRPASGAHARVRQRRVRLTSRARSPASRSRRSRRRVALAGCESTQDEERQSSRPRAPRCSRPGGRQDRQGSRARSRSCDRGLVGERRPRAVAVELRNDSNEA